MIFSQIEIGVKETFEENLDIRGRNIVQFLGLLVVVVCYLKKNIELENKEFGYL